MTDNTHNEERHFAKARGAKRHAVEGRQLRELAELGLDDFGRSGGCGGRQQTMIKRLRRGNFPTGYLDKCDIEICAEDSCTEGCHFGSRRRRYQTISTAVKLMEGKEPFYRVTMVHPAWRAARGRLSDLKPQAIRQWTYRVLSQIEDIIAVGIVEVSLNVEVDSSVHWAGEVQLVVAGTTKERLREALAGAIPRSALAPYAKPVMVHTVSSLGRSLGYAQKRFVERRVAYLDPRTGRQGRNHLPLLQGDALEHDLWLLAMPLGALTIACGCRRRGQKLFSRQQDEG